MADDRGQYKIFLGMAAGVGKTYRMLQEAGAEAAAGRDVLIAYLEPHGREETSAQAEGLDQLPRRTVEYRGTTLQEMDLPAIFRRAPDLALVDELAHTNPPGLEHEKRYQDIVDVLDAGIDVFSTVNVQHLESLNDAVHELTGVRVKETFPDSVLASADEVVLIDLTPQALVSRLRAGKVYRPERVAAALNRFFRVENLATLRELALRQVAEDVEARRTVREPVAGRPGEGHEDGPGAVAEQLLALVTPSPKDERVLRRAARSAARLGADLDALYVRRPGGSADDEEREGLERLRHLAAVLGASLSVEEGDDVADVAAGLAAERGTTYVLMGEPSMRRGLTRLSEPLPLRLIRRLPGVDVRMVADAEVREPGAG